MQTIYLRKGCRSCLKALVKLYKNPDLSNNIIIVNSLQAKILLLDKRVKKFPFIINTQSTNIGLIPKHSRVMELEHFLELRQYDKRIKRNYYSKPIVKTETNKDFKIKKVQEPDGGVEITISR